MKRGKNVTLNRNLILIGIGTFLILLPKRLESLVPALSLISLSISAEQLLSSEM